MPGCRRRRRCGPATNSSWPIPPAAQRKLPRWRDAFGARVLRLEAPGASRARNAGWRAARHSLVAFTDDDCRPQPGWLDALAAASGGRLRHRPGRGARPGGPSGRGQDRCRAGGAGRLQLRAARREQQPPGAARTPRSGRRFRRAARSWDVVRIRGGSGTFRPAAALRVARAATSRMRWCCTSSGGAGAIWCASTGATARVRARGSHCCKGLDRTRSRVRRRRLLWDEGAASAVRDLRAGYEFGALTTAVRTIGTAVGYGYGRVALRSLWMGGET